jgi:hypothetical protein
VVAVKKLIVSLGEMLPQIRLLSRKYTTVHVCMRGSEDHETHGLRDDQVLIKAWGKRKGGES